MFESRAKRLRAQADAVQRIRNGNRSPVEPDGPPERMTDLELFAQMGKTVEVRRAN